MARQTKCNGLLIFLSTPKTEDGFLQDEELMFI